MQVLTRSIENPSHSQPLDDLLERNPSLQIIILQWVDVCGVLRSRLLPVATFRKIVDSGSHLDCAPIDTCVPTTADFIPNIMPYFGHKGKIWPDISSLRIAHDGAGLGNTAICFGDIEFGNSDARSILKALVNGAKESQGLEFLVGMELEFCLLTPGTLDPAEPAPPGVAGTSRTLRSKVWPILNEAITALTEAGVGVEQSVKEYGVSAYEIALSPLPPVEAIDAYVYATELIKNVAYKHGLVATFYPTPYDGDMGQRSGEHIHISATSTDENWNPDTAMAGILSHIPALTALGMPQVDSYERVGIGKMGAGGLVGWGGNNRDMPVRRVATNHWEIRVNDGTSNPYAMVAGIIGATLNPKVLDIKEATRFTLMYSEEEKQELGLTKLLPTTLEAALEELENDRAWASSVLGEGYVEWFLALKKAEMNTVSNMDVQERRLFMLNYF
ncbi:fluG-like protein [Fusarium heterosporum]|uniref:FluG-like protein n=1 Tax=Fusarium heterosporum TaxID=42747 RepID=A0A8H5WQG2_FUSHE|nr:fluG-like protein [Fusarium heterosporum]